MTDLLAIAPFVALGLASLAVSVLIYFEGRATPFRTGQSLWADEGTTIVNEVARPCDGLRERRVNFSVSSTLHDDGKKVIRLLSLMW